MATDRTVVPLLTESIEAVESLGRRANDRERAHAVTVVSFDRRQYLLLLNLLLYLFGDALGLFVQYAWMPAPYSI